MDRWMDGQIEPWEFPSGNQLVFYPDLLLDVSCGSFADKNHIKSALTHS